MPSFTWNALSGLWTAAANWLESGAATANVPGFGDSALIAAPGTYAVTVGSVAVDRIAIGNPGATLVVTGTVFDGSTTAGGLDNAGTVAIGAGGTLVVGNHNGTIVQGGLSNAGLITLGSGAVLRAYAITSTAALGAISSSGGTVALAGYVDNAGQTLTASGFGTLLLAATVNGGTIVNDNGSLVVGPATTGGAYAGLPFLVGATVRGPLAVTGTLATAGGLTLLPLVGGGPGTMDLAGQFSPDGGTTLDNAVMNFGIPGIVSAPSILSGGSLTFGADTIINAGTLPTPGGAAARIFVNTLTLHGTVAVSGFLTLIAFGFTNTGLIAVAPGGGIGVSTQLETDIFTNTGAIQVDDGSITLGINLTGAGTLALANGASASTWQIGGGQTVGFGGSGNTLTLRGMGSSFATTGFDATDRLVFGSLPSPAAFTTFGNGTLDVISQSGSLIARVTMTDVPANADFHIQNSAGSGVFTVTVTETVPCFAAGTRLRTPEGEVAVERLRPGDRLVSAFGGTAPVVWVGHRQVRADRHPDPASVWPVRIRAGALAPGVPLRDLYLSPEHALYLDGHLVPVRHLVNGRSIVQERRAAIAYHHVELPQHDVVFAEGAPSETYLDTGNRADFANGGMVAAAHPVFASPDAAWQALACAPQCRGGPVLDALRRRIASRDATRRDAPPGITGPAAAARSG